MTRYCFQVVVEVDSDNKDDAMQEAIYKMTPEFIQDNIDLFDEEEIECDNEEVTGIDD